MQLAASAVWLASLLLPGPAFAAGVTIVGDDPQQRVSITIENATIDVVLDGLHQKYGFEVGGIKNADQGEPISAVISGDLHSVLERLLRNRNYMIVVSKVDAARIEKVVIVNAAYGAVAAKATEAATNADRQQMQALTGGD